MSKKLNDSILIKFLFLQVNRKYAMLSDEVKWKSFNLYV